ncbi:MAG TPA: hypothetical protein P5307_25785, partial [Pirellulaceae bacterium]|nr:hypothetical protein [Pirellulaceae bacterium]
MLLETAKYALQAAVWLGRPQGKAESADHLAERILGGVWPRPLSTPSGTADERQLATCLEKRAGLLHQSTGKLRIALSAAAVNALLLTVARWSRHHSLLPPGKSATETAP